MHKRKVEIHFTSQMAQFLSTGFSGLSTMSEEARYQVASLASVILLIIAYFIACSHHNNESLHDKHSSPKIAVASPAPLPTNNINHDINREGETKEEAKTSPSTSPAPKKSDPVEVAFEKFPASNVNITLFLEEMRKGLPVNYSSAPKRVEKKVLRLSNKGELYWSKDKVMVNSIMKTITPKKVLEGRNQTADLVSVFVDKNDSNWFIVEFKTKILKMQVQDTKRNAEIITSLTVLANKVKTNSAFATDIDAKIAKSKPVLSPAPASIAPAPAPIAPAPASTPGAEQNVWRDVASTAKA